MSSTARKPNSYDRDQHQLICAALGVSSDCQASGPSAYEAVSILLDKLDSARMALKPKTSPNLRKKMLKFLNTPIDKFDVFTIR